MKLPKYKLRFLVIFAIPFCILIIILGGIQDSISIPKTYEKENKNPLAILNTKDTSFKEIAIKTFHSIPFSFNQDLTYELKVLIIGENLTNTNFTNEEISKNISLKIDSILTLYWELYENDNKIITGNSLFNNNKYKSGNYLIDSTSKYWNTNAIEFCNYKVFAQFSLSSLNKYKLRYKVISNDDKNYENKYFIEMGIADFEYSGIGARSMNKTMLLEITIILSILVFFATLFIASLLYVYLHNRSLKKEIENEYIQRHPNPPSQEL